MGVRVLPMLGPEWRTWRRRETAFAITKEHRNTVAVVFGCYDVGLPIAVEVSNGHLRCPFTHIKIAVGNDGITRSDFCASANTAGSPAHMNR